MKFFFQICEYPCQCPVHELKCDSGVSIVKNGCGCCYMCARQHGELCNVKDVCDVKQDLYCDLTLGHVPGVGICKGKKALQKALETLFDAIYITLQSSRFIKEQNVYRKLILVNCQNVMKNWLGVNDRSDTSFYFSLPKSRRAISSDHI